MRLKNTVTLIMTKMGIRLFRLIPFFGIYLLSDLLRFFLKRVIRYRRKVIFANLSTSFTELSAAEIEAIGHKTYQNLCDITLESIKGLSMSPEHLRERYRIVNPEILDHSFQRGESVILAGAHYGNWEWGVRSWSLWFKHKVMGIYKPLANKTVESFLNARREDFGMKLVSPKHTKTAIEEAQKNPCLLVLFGDQNPHNLNTCHWVPFLFRDTAWLQGVAEISHQKNFSVYYLKTQRIKRGYYESRLVPLVENPTELRPLEISERYAAMVEQNIREKPEDWLWSHKRWKHKR